MRITKREIIKILGDTKLASKEYAQADGSVCAVGAIVRAYMAPNTDPKIIGKFAEANAPAGSAKRFMPLIERRKYLDALSVHFENVMYDNNDVYDGSVREEILNFTAQYFPDHIELFV